MSKGKGGRHSKYFTHVQPRLKEIEKWCREGLIEVEICKRLGVSYPAFANYKNLYVELIDTLKQKAIADYQVVNALFRRATGYEFEETTRELCIIKDKEGNPIYEAVFDSKGHPIGHRIKEELKVTKIVTKELAPDPTSIIFWSKNRMPNDWRDRIEHSLEFTDIRQLPTDQLIDEINRIAKVVAEDANKG